MSNGHKFISIHPPPKVLALIKFLLCTETWFGTPLVLKLNMGERDYTSIQVKVKWIHLLIEEKTNLLRSLLRMKNQREKERMNREVSYPKRKLAFDQIVVVFFTKGVGTWGNANNKLSRRLFVVNSCHEQICSCLIIIGRYTILLVLKVLFSLSLKCEIVCIIILLSGLANILEYYILIFWY